MSHESEPAEGEAACTASISVRHHRSATTTRTTAGRRRVLPRGRAEPAHTRRQRREAPSEFYAGVLAGLDPRAFAEARDVGGLEEEIALLRLQLRELIKEKPEDFGLVLQAINTLVRAVAAEYQHAEPDQQEMMRRMADAVRQLGGLIDEE